MVKALEEDFFEPLNHTDADWLNIEEFLKIRFVGPKSVQGHFPTPILKLVSARRPTDYFTVGSLNLVSERFRRELDAVSADMEYFHVKILTKRNTPYTDTQIYFAHLLKEIDCFDYTRSQFEFDTDNPNYVRRVYKLFVREEAIGTEPVFWIKNVCFTKWLVSDDFAERIRAAKITGVVLNRLEDAIAKL